MSGRSTYTAQLIRAERAHWRALREKYTRRANSARSAAAREDCLQLAALAERNRRRVGARIQRLTSALSLDQLSYLDSVSSQQGAAA